jgi:hypothetical protein
MNREELRDKWNTIVDDLSAKFADGEPMDVDSIIFIIGVQELNLGIRKFKKDEKVNLMHIAICKLLEPYGYYKYTGRDADGWPHYEMIESLPQLKPGEQSFLMKEAIVKYFDDQRM